MMAYVYINIYIDTLYTYLYSLNKLYDSLLFARGPIQLLAQNLDVEVIENVVHWH